MKKFLVVSLLCAGALVSSRSSVADEADVSRAVEKVVAAAGGKEKLLRLFRITEQLNVTSDPTRPGNARRSVLEPPKHWWVGKRERVQQDKEPAIFLVWAWTLAPLTDPASSIELVPDVMERDRPALGLRVSKSIDPSMELYFDKETNRLVRIDWRADIHRFSEWRDHDGATYPAKCVGYKKKTGKPWYFTEITELERLQKLPDDLQ